MSVSGGQGSTEEMGAGRGQAVEEERLKEGENKLQKGERQEGGSRPDGLRGIGESGEV